MKINKYIPGVLLILFSILWNNCAISEIFVFSIPFSRKQSRAFSVTSRMFFSRCSSCGK